MQFIINFNNALQIMMATVQDEEAELYAKNEAANKVFNAKEKAILDRQAAAEEDFQTATAQQRSMPLQIQMLPMIAFKDY